MTDLVEKLRRYNQHDWHVNVHLDLYDDGSCDLLTFTDEIYEQFQSVEELLAYLDQQEKQ